MKNKEVLLGKSPEEIKVLIEQLGMKSFVAKQITQWLYQKQISDFDQMTNISKPNRDKLKQYFEIGRSQPVSVQESTDGTKKYLYKTANGHFIEAAFIPEETRNTLCVFFTSGMQNGLRVLCDWKDEIPRSTPSG
jgi:23S rRNA (adenine2503-C2)-methyltransferase